MNTKITENSEFSKQNAENLQEKLVSEVEPITFLPIPIGEQRLHIPISLVQGIKPQIVSIIKLDELFQLFQTNDAKALDFKKSLATFFLSDKEKYKQLKSKCQGFMIGEFSHRRDSDCKQYAPLMAFDIDGYEDAFYLDLDLSELKKDKHTFAAFPSPSGHGLRILIWADVIPDTHKVMYELVLQHLCDILHLTTDKKNGTHLDISTSNISRHWYFTAVKKEEFYLNLDSLVFVKPVVAVEKPKTKQQIAIEKASIEDISFTTQEKIDFCVGRLQDLYSYGGRNNYVFRVACTLNEHGITKDDIVTYCTQFQDNDFTIKEIEKAIESAIKRSQFAKYSDAQIAHYFAKKEGKKTPLINEKTSAEGNNTTSKKGKTKIDKIINYCSDNFDLRFNEIAIEVESSTKGANIFEPLNSNDLVIDLLQNKINGCERMLKNYLSSTRIKRFDPFKYYFESLPQWKEGDTDYIGQLASFILVQDRFFFDTQFKKMFVRMLACGIGELPFNKQCIVFVGKQNDGKTSLIRFLCPPPLRKYVKENLEMDKDGRLALCQNFIINLDELATLSKQDINQIKSYFTTETVKERPPYGDKPIAFKRRASFIASTNNDDILTDETGNVRWVIFKIDGINHDNGGQNGYNQIDINLVWSQAYALYKSGFTFQLTKEELEYSEKNNNQNYRKTFSEYELLQNAFEPAKKDQEGAAFMHTTDIKEALEGGLNSRKLNLTYLGKALRMLGFETVSKYNEKRKISIKGYWVKALLPDNTDTNQDAF
jgi:predicted P-loop ATPase